MLFPIADIIVEPRQGRRGGEWYGCHEIMLISTKADVHGTDGCEGGIYPEYRDLSVGSVKKPVLHWLVNIHPGHMIIYVNTA